MSQNDRPEAPSPATAANGSTAAKEENPTARALVSSSKAEAESEQGAQSGGVRRLAIDVLPSGFHRTGEISPTEIRGALGSNQLLPRIYIAFVLLVGILLFSSLFVNWDSCSISSRLASCRKSYMLSVLEQHFSCSSSLPHQWKIWNPYGCSNTPYGVMDELASPISPRKDVVQNYCLEFMQLIRSLCRVEQKSVRSSVSMFKDFPDLGRRMQEQSF
ncbi:hypothetical protein Ahy_A03g013249 isoform A [Arachis hypogaea]|uniref:Uncharacterized protein n=1 Tax=Arachis hypogaea TaxID=3818 RepID=A0A445DV03_ARAHY|nr:hypothetical protein Ahy_A03g013249 isoform A [Arachis hypogaea]